MGKLSSCNWVFCKKRTLSLKSDLHITSAPLNDSSQYYMVEHASTCVNIDMAREHLFTKKFVDEMTALTRGGFVPAHFESAYQGSCVRVSTRTGEMNNKSSKL